MYSTTYRPFSFPDIAGHTGIITELKNRSKEQNFPQVMIMEGNSGTGKTTIGLIIAGILNCLKPIKHDDGSYSPCGICESCKNIRDEKFTRDIYFLDASSMSKDDVLNIQNIVNTCPMYDKNQIIIIDEAQELSKAGKGATLKLLEKKRKNTYFILCTMNEKALDRAIKSRGQTYLFRPVDSILISNYLYKVLSAEKLINDIPEEFFTKGIFIIAENANGSVREGLQLLERVIYGKYYTEEAISKELGLLSYSTSVELLFDLLDKKVDFFKKLPNYDLKNFFYYSWKILIEAKVYQCSNYSESEWKTKSFKNIIKRQNLNNLLKVYTDTMQQSYLFIKNLFYSNLLDYYSVASIPLIRKVKD